MVLWAATDRDNRDTFREGSFFDFGYRRDTVSPGHKNVHDYYQGQFATGQLNSFRTIHYTDHLITRPLDMRAVQSVHQKIIIRK
jgi:hypothetical protein